MLDQSVGIEVRKVAAGMPARLTLFIAHAAELELGGPRAIPVIVCIAWTAELELGVPRGAIYAVIVSYQNAGSSLVMCPHAEDLHRTVVLQYLIDQPMLDVDSSRVGAGEIAN